MKIRDWDQLPDSIRLPEVRKYYDSLKGKSLELYSRALKFSSNMDCKAAKNML